MAVKGPFPMLRSWFVNVTSNLRHNRCSKSDIWDKMSVHYIYVKPVGAGVNHLGAFCAQIREIGGENGGCDNGGRRHRGRPAEIDLNERSFAQIPVFWDLGQLRLGCRRETFIERIWRGCFRASRWGSLKLHVIAISVLA